MFAVSRKKEDGGGGLLDNEGPVGCEDLIRAKHMTSYQKKKPD